MSFNPDKKAYDSDTKEHIEYIQRIARAKRELRNRIPKRLLKRKEIWEMNKTPYQVFKINAVETWRKFDLKTRGMGLYLVCLMGIMLIAVSISPILDFVMHESNKAKYANALKTACLEPSFYSWNFASCEDINVRPIIPTPTEPTLKENPA